MKLCLKSLPLLAVALTGSAFGQTMMLDDFDSRALGSLNGIDGYFTSTSVHSVVATGVGLPTPTSGSQMLASRGLSGTLGNFIGTKWSARNPSNNILLSEIDFQMSSSDTTGRSVNFGISDNFGNRIGNIGYAGSTFFAFSNLSGFVFGPSGATRDTWHHLKLVSDFNTGVTDCIVDGSSLGTVLFNTSNGVNSIVWNSAGGSGTNASAYFDSLKVQAVPEPATMLVLGAGAFGLMRRRRKN